MDKVHSINSCIPKVSIFSPVYNMEEYIQECIDSVLNQSFQDFEYILVDDGSTDRCGEICDIASSKDTRIRVVHQKNGGLSAARKTGLENSRGEWIFVVDPDDRLPPNALSDLFNVCDELGYNIDDFDVIEGVHVFFKTDEKTRKEVIIPSHNDVSSQKYSDVTVASGFDYLKDLTSTNDYFTGATWRKIIRRSLLLETDAYNVSRDFVRGQDVLSCLKMGKKLRKALKTQKFVYEYRLNPNTIAVSKTYKYSSFGYVSYRWNAIKEILQDVPCGEELYKTYIINKWLYSFIHDRKHTWSLRSVEFRPYLDILLEKWSELSKMSKACLLVTRFPFKLIPERFYFALLFGTKAVVLAPRHLLQYVFSFHKRLKSRENHKLI